MTHEETLRQWLDPELGGTMPREIREAGLALLSRLADIEDAQARGLLFAEATP